MTIRQRPARLAPQCRALSLRADAAGATVDQESRTLRFPFSSEEPVDMWYGTEILSHADGAMRNGVRQTSMPLLYNHCRDDLLGVVEGVEIGADARAYATVRFGKDDRGEWAMKQAADRVLTNASFLYRVYKCEEDAEEETYTATDWEPYEISLVTVPADATVGIGRSDGDDENDITITRAGAPPPAAKTEQQQPATAGFFSGRDAAASTPEKGSTTMNQRHHLREQANDGTTGSAGGAVVIDPVKEQARGAESERARIAQIEALCRKYEISEEVRTGMIQRGATIDLAKMTVCDIVMERQKAKPSVDLGETHNPDLSEKEKAGYSMIRAINAALAGDWKKAGFEVECSNEISKRLGRAPQNERSFFVPTNIPFAQRAAYAVGTAGAGVTGGTMVATNLLAGSFIEVLRNKARVMQLGATMLSGLIGQVDIPRQTGQTATFWTAEGVNTTEAEATFDKVSLTLKTIGTYSQVSRNMLLQSTPDIDMIVRADLIAAMARGIDLAALSGTGSGGQPTGIANTAGIGSVIGGTNGAQLTIDNIIDLETAVTFANAPEDSLAYLTNAKAIGWLKKAKSTTNQYLWTNSPGGQRSGTPGEINGYPVARSNQARSTLTKGTSNGICSEVFFGAWSELLIGEWGVLEIVPNPYDAAVYKNGGVLLRALQSLDIGVRHAASFSTMSDALTA